MGGSPVVCGDSIQPLCQPAPSVAMGDKGGPGAACAAQASANPTSRAYHVCGLMHTCNKDRFMWTTCSARRVLGRWGAVAAAGLVAMHAAAGGQPAVPPPGDQPPSGGALSLSSPSEPPSPRATLAAYRTVDSWVRAWAAPGAEAPLPADLPACYGACVHLRLNGQLVGRGIAAVTSAVDAASATFIRDAAEEAIRTADARLPVPNDLTRGDAIKLLTPEIQISLELAGAPIPIVDDSWSLVDALLAPGIDGVMVQRQGAAGQEGAALEFPSQMMLAGALPQNSLRTLTARVIGEGGAAEVLLMPREIRDKHAVKMYRFRVSHVAQCRARQGAEFLYRGSKLVGASIGRAELEMMAAGMAAFLERRIAAAAAMRTRDGDGAGDKAPPEVDGAGKSVLLAAVALRAHSDLAMGNVDADRHEVLRDRVNEILPTGPRGLIERALYLNARFPNFKGNATRQAKCDDVIRAVMGEPRDESVLKSLGAELLEEVEEARKTPLDPVERAVVLANYTGWARGGDDAARSRVVTEPIRQLFVDTPSERLPSLMPWLGWAELNLAAMRSSAGGPPVDVPSALALRAMRDEVWKHQLTPLDATDDSADMVGGIVFTSGATTPLPTWQCVRPLAFMATMLGDRRLTEPQERALELARLLQAMRYVRQLQIDESSGWMLPSPQAAMGGVRGAVWDYTLNPDATSLSLLAVVELLESMDQIESEMLKEGGLPASAQPAKGTGERP